MKANRNPIRIDMAGQKQQLRVNTKPDVESGMATPNKKKKKGSTGTNLPSPTKTAPMTPETPQTIQFQHNVNSTSGRGGGGGFCRWKPILILTVMLGLAGGLAYFLLSWLEIPGMNAQIDRLEAEVDRLGSEVDRLESQVDRLGVENERYEDLNDKLNTSVAELQVINTNLTVSIAELEALSISLNASVVEYKKANAELSTVVAFLNNTANDLGTTFDSITSYLSDQISANQALVLQSMENYYRAQVSNWDCDYRNVFLGKLWASNFNIEISFADRQEVIDYVASNVLDELCIDKAEFTQYLEANYDLLTSAKLVSAVTVVTQQALDFYFPEDGEVGLSHGEWATADFKCENLERKYQIVT